MENNENSTFITNLNNNKQQQHNMEAFYKLLALALSDGIITAREKELLLLKAKELGLDEIEAEMIIENELSKVQNNEKEPEETDGFLISNEELLLRTIKWINLIAQKNVKEEIETFPRLKSQTKNYHKYTDEAVSVLKKINSGIVGNVAGKVPVVGGLIKVGLSLGGTNTIQKIDHDAIVKLAEQYLMILELRTQNNEFIEKKYQELKNHYQAQLDLWNQNQKSFRSLFK